MVGSNGFTRRELLHLMTVGTGASALGIGAAVASANRHAAKATSARLQGEYEGVTLRMLTQAGVAYEPALQAFASEFQADTGAIIEFDFTPWEQLMPKIQADLAAGTPQYDLFGNDIEFQYTIYPSLLPINDLIEERGYDMEGFFEPVYRYGEGVAGGLEGTRFGLPIRVGASWVFYRTDLITEFPTTWVEYEEILAENTTDGRYGVSFAGVAAQLVKLFLARYWSQGEPLLTPEWQPLINREAGVAAAQMLYDHLHNYAPPGVLGWDNPDASNAFLNGDAAVLEGWASFILPSLEDPAAEIAGNWSVARYPEDGTGNFTQHNMVIFNTTEHPDAAFDFMAYCTGPDNARRLLMEFEEESPRKTIWTEPDVLEERPYLEPVAEAYDVGKPFTPGLPQWLEMFIGLAEGLSAAMADQQEVQEAMDGVAGRWEDLIRQAPPDFEYQE